MSVSIGQWLLETVMDSDIQYEAIWPSPVWNTLPGKIHCAVCSMEDEPDRILHFSPFIAHVARFSFDQPSRTWRTEQLVH